MAAGCLHKQMDFFIFCHGCCHQKLQTHNSGPTFQGNDTVERSGSKNSQRMASLVFLQLLANCCSVGSDPVLRGVSVFSRRFE